MKQSLFKLTFLVILICTNVILTFAQKPQWVGNTPKELNKTYMFVEVVSTGTTLNEAQANAKEKLALDKQLQQELTLSIERKHIKVIDKHTLNGRIASKNQTNRIISEVSIKDLQVAIQAKNVDEYAERRNGMIELHTLFMVALYDDPVFDRTYLTTRYGAAPVFMSIIPGLGQWHKGSKTKAICLFAAEAASVAGIIVCDNQRASYIKKMKEQPKFAKEYNTKADNWETGRNVCIGVAASIWIYNLIDAAVAKGARKVVVNRADGSTFAVRPMASFEGAGVSFAYRF